ncbi:MAG: hypothetical protein J6S89_06525 [Paludibacteraceae bacterium]|nr:hypothetical protein [Paludibacteraceae bacterium]
MVNRCFFFHFKDFHNLIINNRKKQIELCPNFNGNNKEWCKEFVETMVKQELEKLKMELEEVVAGQYCLKRIYIKMR